MSAYLESKLVFLPLNWQQKAKKPCLMAVWRGTPQSCLTDLHEGDIKAYVSSCVNHNILQDIINDLHSMDPKCSARRPSKRNMFAIHGRSGNWERQRRDGTGIHKKEFAIHLAVDLIAPEMLAFECARIPRRCRADYGWLFKEVIRKVREDSGHSCPEEAARQPTLVHMFGTYIIPTTSISSGLCRHVCNVIAKAKASEIDDLEWGVVCWKEDDLLRMQLYILTDPGEQISKASDVKEFSSYLEVRQFLYGKFLSGDDLIFMTMEDVD